VLACAHGVSAGTVISTAYFYVFMSQLHKFKYYEFHIPSTSQIIDTDQETQTAVMKFGVFTVVLMKIPVFWHMLPCRLVHEVP